MYLITASYLKYNDFKQEAADEDIEIERLFWKAEKFSSLSALKKKIASKEKLHFTSGALGAFWFILREQP